MKELKLRVSIHSQDFFLGQIALSLFLVVVRLPARRQHNAGAGWAAVSY
jgi:hypothetical protein